MKEILPIYETKLVRRGRRRPQTATLNSRALFDLVRPYFQNLDREHLVIVYFDGGLHPFGFKIESIGSTSQCLADMRLIVRDALLANARAIALSHNHLSGICEPSHEDTRLTNKIGEAVKLVDITCVDHLIVSHDKFYSFADHGFFSAFPR